MHQKITGEITSITLRPVKGGTLNRVSKAELSTEKGLVGDHYAGKSGRRQVTLILSEHLQAIAQNLNLKSIDHEQTRRNLLVSGLNSNSFSKGMKIAIGSDAVVEITGDCRPCDRMNKTIGSGALDAMKGLGGYTARVIEGGTFRTGDSVRPV
ncbi:MAG: MOSC domain-containing protein [Saprospirales bacterium]|nr:MAG: MOSC domain-containing protein [Saprospirales bacterium]